MINRLMVSVATVALIAGSGFAYAQGAGGAAKESGGAEMHGAPSTGGAASGTSAGGAAMERHDSAGSAGGSEMKSSQSEQKSPTGAKNQRAEDNMKGQKSKGMSSENETKGGQKDMKAEGANKAQGGSRAEGARGEGANSNMKAEGKNGERNGERNAEGRNGERNAEGRSNNMNAEGKSTTERSQVTTGQAGAGAKLSTEQRTKISTVIRNEHVTPLNNVNFSVSVGTRVPHDIQYRPLPAEVVSIYPEWRGYDFILVHDQIVVIDPQTFEIVAVLDT